MILFSSQKKRNLFPAFAFHFQTESAETNSRSEGIQQETQSLQMSAQRGSVSGGSGGRQPKKTWGRKPAASSLSRQLGGKRERNLSKVECN